MEKNLIAKFEINVPKTAKALAKFVGKDESKPILNYICIEPERGIMSATDTHALQIVKIEAAGEYPDGLQVLADPKHIAKAAGKHVEISVFEEVREAEETRTIYRGAFCGSRTITEKVNRTFRIAVIECGDETYTTETRPGRFPDVMRVIPKRDGRKAIRLTAESVEALKTICKLHKASYYIALDIVEGSDFITVYDQVHDYLENRTRYTLKLEAPAELTATIGCKPQNLATCLNGSDGAMSFARISPQSCPLLIGGEAEATLLMPYNLDCDTFNHIDAVRAGICPALTSFAEDAAAAVAELQHHASELWQFIVGCYTKDGKCGLTPGNYSAKDIADRDKAKCGRYVIAYGCGYDYENTLTIKHGNINIVVSNDSLFSVLAAWESAVKCKKSVFAVGNVEEVSETVLTYTEGGAVEEKKKLRKLGGNWYCDAKRTAKSYDTTIYYDINGVKFSVHRMPWNEIDDTEIWQQWADRVEKQTVVALNKKAETGDPYYSEVVKRIEATRHTATDAGIAQIPASAAETLECATEGETAQEEANIEDMKRHYDKAANVFYKYNLYRFNDVYAFGKEADLLRGFFNGHRFAELKWMEHTRGGIYYLRFHHSYMDEIKDYLKNKLNLENILIGVWDSEEVMYWCKHNPPQPPEAPPTANYATPTPKRRQRPRKRPYATTPRHQHHTPHKVSATTAPRAATIPPPSGIWAAANAPPLGD